MTNKEKVLNGTFEIKKEHFGKMHIGREVEPKMKFNQIVICVHPFIPVVGCIGRVVQIRRGRGQFRSDQIFIRTLNEDLTHWENQSFFGISDKYIGLYEKMFTNMELDEPNTTYTVHNSTEPETGFIIPKSDKKFESTAPDTPFSIMINDDKCVLQV